MSVHALSLSQAHTFSKQSVPSVTLLPGLGVAGDCHCGETVQHRSRLHIKPPPKNLRQIHLFDLETLEQFNIKPGELGENVTVVGVGLLGLGKGTKLHFLPPVSTATASTTNNGIEANGVGAISQSDSDMLKMTDHPILVVTGLRNPCPQISHFRPGLQEQFIVRDEERKIIARKAGVMSIVEAGAGGVVKVGMRIVVEPLTIWQPLECV